MNSFIQAYRAQRPDDPATDEELVLEYGDKYPAEQFPADFVTDYRRLKTGRDVEASGVGTEVVRGFKRGLTGLETSAAVAIALAADTLGEDAVKNYWLDIYKRKLGESAKEPPPSVPTVQQAATSIPAAAQYVAGKAGELIPNVGEALVAAGAGTMVAPGAGTEAGAIAGLFAKGAARAAIRRTIEKGLTADVANELEDFAAGKITGQALSKKAAQLVTNTSKYLAGTGASAANFAALGAGGGYGTLAETPGVSPADARIGAAIAGAGASIGAMIPGHILKGLFGESIGETAARNYIDLYAKKVPAELLTGAGGMGAMEFFNVVAEHYADPAKRGKDFSEEDLSRIANAGAVGVLAGVPAAGISAIRGVKREPVPVSTPPPAQPPATPAAAPTPGIAANYPVPPEAIVNLRMIVEAERSGKINPAEVEAYLAKNPEFRPTYQKLKSEVANATQVGPVKEVVPSERVGADALVQQAAQDRVEPPVQPKESAQAGPGDRVLETAGGVEIKPPPASAEAAPQTEAPTAAEVSQAKPPAVTAAEVPPAISEPTAKPTTKQPDVSARATPEPQQPTDTSWIESVPTSYSAWVTPSSGKEKATVFAKRGFVSDANNKEATNTKAAFQRPDGSIVVATVKKTQGVERVEQGSGKKAKSWDALIKDGWKPIGFSRGTTESKFYREYTPEQWADLRRQLEEKSAAAKAEVAPEPEPITPAAAAEDRMGPAGKAEAIEPKGALTAQDAKSINDLVIEEVGGFPESGEVVHSISRALLRDPDIQARLRDVAGTSELALERLVGRIFGVYERAAESGETDLGKLQERIARELEGLDARERKEPAKPAATLPGADKPPAEPSREHLATTAISRDVDPSPRAQTLVRNVLSQARNAYEALVGLSKAGVFGDDKIVKDLIELGDHGTRLALGGEHTGQDGKQSLGRYDAPSHTLHVFDFAFTDGASARTFLHEYVHGNTVFQLETGRHRAELTLLYETAVEAAGKEKTHYGLTNQAEFLAEAFSNPEFQGFLRSIKPLGLQETLWTRFLNWIGRLIGIKDPTLLDEVVSVGERISGKYKPRPIQVPESAHTVQRMTPIYGDKETVESYNPATGRVEASPVIQDSVESALQNVNRIGEGADFLLPANTRPIPTVDPAVQMTNEHAINNKVEEVLTRGANDAGVTIDQARLINGLHNTKTVREALAFQESVRNIQNVNREQTFEGLRHEVNVNYVATAILGSLEKVKTKIGKVLSEAKEKKPDLEARHTELLKEHSEVLDNLEDATFMSRTINNGVRKILKTGLDAVGRLGQELGIAFQMHQELEGKLGQPIDRATVNIFKRLSTSDALEGEKMFDFMNQMANDPSIDFSQKASQIRSYIRHAAELDPAAPTSHRYAQLSEDSPEARALLSTVIAYGKLNRRVVTLLQVRSMDGPDRAALKQELRDQLKESTGQIVTGVRQVAKASALAERAKAENRESLRQIADVKRKLERAEKIISINEKLLPHYDAEIDRITPKVKQTEDTVFGDGMVLRVPKSNDLHTKWDEVKLNLKVSSGNPTTVAEVKSAFDKMLLWTKLREQEALLGNDVALGLDYQRVSQQVRAIAKQKIYDPVLRATDHTLVGLFMGSNAKAIGALGTPVAKLIEVGTNKFAGDTTNLRTAADKEFGFRNTRLVNKVLSVLNQGQAWYQRSKVVGPWFEANILNSALGFLERGVAPEWLDLKTAQDQWFAKLGPWLLSHENVRPLIEDRMPQFMSAMRELVDSIYMSGQWWVKKNVEAGMLVKEPSLGGRLRKHIEQGLWTFQRKFSDGFFNTVHALRGSGWAEDKDVNEIGASKAWQNFSNIYSQDPAAGEALVNKYVGHKTYGDTVQKDFLYKLTHVPDGSVIRTPVLDESGTKISADPEVVAKIYDEAGGNLIQFFQKLHEYYNGQEAQSDYIQSELMNLASVFHKLDAALKKVEPKSPTEVTTFVGLVPNAMIDARELQHLPSDWFNYHRFDNNDNARIAERTAWQINFGREGRELANWHATAQVEADAARDLLNVVLNQAQDNVPNGRRKDIDAYAAKVLAADPHPMLAPFKTGQDRLKFLRNIDKRYPFIQSFLRGMTEYFNRSNQADGSLRWGIRMSQELASLLVNQPSSAIAQLATTVDIFMQWGLSPATLKATARTIQMTSKDIAGSLAQGIGWEFLKPSYYEKRGLEMGLFSPLSARRMGDIFGTLTGEENSRTSKFWRQAKDVQAATLNLRGEAAQYTPLQPFAPFFQFVTAANRGLFVSLAEMADGYVSKGVEFLRSHPGVDKITADDLGLNRFDRNTFDIWQKDHARYGLDFNDMVRGAKERADRGDRTVLTDQEIARIYSVGLNAISLESNIATMPLWAFNNGIARFGLPLLGWSYRRAGQLAALRLNTNDKTSLYSVGNALLGIAATGLGGLGLSLIVDAYSEDILGKKRNIRPLRFPTDASDIIGVQERLAKVGTFGLWGELLNNAVNVGTGQGDNRMLSVDQRVVSMQSFQSILKATSNLINQGGDADYRNVIRPVIGAIGGSGMLQYMQIMNHAFDFDNVESRVVKRINAENYLRVTGRDLGMNIRTGGGGYATPTPITPWLARMEYAAYANDPVDFRVAWNGAKAEAKAAGKADQEDYVKKAFETRHPLRYVFAQVPSQREYRQVLANLDDLGKESVTEAVRLFNYYGGHIGLEPFQGSVKKDQPRVVSTPALLRARAMSMAY